MIKVLVVEDEELIRRGIVLTVDWASLGCVVAGEASNGEEGLELAEKCGPALIITDLKMPKMDGIEMLRRLRARGSTAQVIILTAYDTFQYAQSALRLGAADYLLKPFRDGELEQAISRLRPRLEGADPGISVGSVAQHLGLSEGHLSHLFKKETDCTLLSYLTRCRIHRATELLRDCRAKVYQVAEQVGYRDIAYFSATFKKLMGMSPSEYQDRCK